jgi:phosphatidylserine/phosphatidylglycerophosphate/cardiolipin synthase-like enzyme
MTLDEIDAWLIRSLDDQRVSRNERRDLSEFFAGLESTADRDTVRRRVFEVARTAMKQPDDLAVITWLEEATRAIREIGRTAPRPEFSEAYFSPGEDCPRAIMRLLTNASRTAEICVFTITDDRLAAAILDAHRRGVSVRIITDDTKAEDLGSDIERFERSGIPTLVDRSPFHMHHKFAILDGETLLTGSYNWTRGAARDNEENLIVTNDRRLLASFKTTFERLWAKLVKYQ